ncbi:MAG: hypothetical protein JJU13_12070 [Balneolaceae bacterium]|nr:hypothetical protein [Balneolaceae bacterium]
MGDSISNLYKKIPSVVTSLIVFITLASFTYVGCKVNDTNSLPEEEREEKAVSVKGCNADSAMPVNLCSEMGEGWIFCDDFESDEPLEDRYFEYVSQNGSFAAADDVGRAGGRGLRADFQEGRAENGNLKFSFGKHQDESMGNKAVSPDEHFHEIYWRFDLCHEAAWIGGGGYKLTRSMTLMDGWKQGHIAHIWDGGPQQHHLRMDPASGIDEAGNMASTRYNDFENLRWLGAVNGKDAIFHPDSVGTWYSIEVRVKLNTPGESDGIFEFWVDGDLQAGRDDYNWHGSFNQNPENPGINAIFIENYWNNGAITNQTRFFDNFVVSTQKIGDLRNVP